MLNKSGKDKSVVVIVGEVVIVGVGVGLEWNIDGRIESIGNDGDDMNDDCCLIILVVLFFISWIGNNDCPLIDCIIVLRMRFMVTFAIVVCEQHVLQKIHK